MHKRLVKYCVREREKEIEKERNTGKVIKTEERERDLQDANQLFSYVPSLHCLFENQKKNSFQNKNLI